MLYDIGQVDASGRVASRNLLDALRWQPRQRLEVIMTQGAMVLRACPDGLFLIPRKPRIVIPATVRQRYGIRPGSHVLVAAAPDFGLAIVYPLSAVDEMIARYHSAHAATETPPS